MKIKLYHGTSTQHFEKIKALGCLNQAYLTSCSEQANYYAEQAAEEDGSLPKILVINIHTSSLLADVPSFDEPLTYILDEHHIDKEEWHEAIEDERIPYPKKNDWKTSLKYVFSVKTKSSVNLLDIEEGDLTEEDHKLISSLLNHGYSDYRV